MTHLSRTLELRWFHEGTIPGDVEDWFLTNDRFQLPLRIEHAQSRSDLYLITGRDDFEVKLREEALDVKRHDPDVLSAKTPVPGVSQVWSKWIWRSPGLPLERLWQRGANRLLVSKTKWQRRIRLVEKPQKLDPQFDYLGIGFIVELAHAAAWGEHWWSLCFDVSLEIAESEPQGMLERGVAWTLEDFPPDRLKELREDNSYSYAEWLVILQDRRPHLFADERARTKGSLPPTR